MLTESPPSLAVTPFLRGEADGKERGKHFAESAQAMCRGEEGAGAGCGDTASVDKDFIDYLDFKVMNDNLDEVKLFEVPIYRCAPEAFQREDKERKEKYQAIHERLYPAEEFKYMQWRSFRYNEVIGWIVIYGNTRRIRAEYWLTRERVNKYLIRKTYQGCGKLFKFRVERQLTSAQIFESLRDRLLSVANEDHELAKRWIDTECFENAGRAMNWREALGL